MKQNLFALLMFSTASMVATASVIKVPVPRSQILLNKETPSEKSKPFQLKVSVSSWSPSALSGPSRLLKTTDYKTSGQVHPKIELGQEIFQNNLFSTQLLFGFTYLQLERSGELNNGSTVTLETETLDVFQFPLGVELLGNSILTTADLRPLLKLAAIPTYSRSSSGTFTNGISALNWVGSSAVGISYGLPRKMGFFMFNNFSVAAGYEASQSLDSSNLNGTGFWFLLGMDLN